MKKIFVIMFFISVLLNAVSLYAGNAMIPDSWSITIISMANADTEPPYVTDKFPAPGSVGVPINTIYSCHVKDNLCGVDINTIAMEINGNNVPLTITGDKNDYYIQGNPGILPWNTIVNIVVFASDLSNN